MEKDIIQLKVDMREVKTDMKHIKKGHEDLSTKVDNGFDTIGKKIDNLDTKFSAKWVEKFLIRAAWIIGSAALLGLLGLILKATLYFYK